MVLWGPFLRTNNVTCGHVDAGNTPAWDNARPFSGLYLVYRKMPLQGLRHATAWQRDSTAIIPKSLNDLESNACSPGHIGHGIMFMGLQKDTPVSSFAWRL